MIKINNYKSEKKLDVYVDFPILYKKYYLIINSKFKDKEY